MATNHFLLGLLCLVFTHCGGLFSRSSLDKSTGNRELPTENRQLQTEKLQIQKLLSIARSQVGIREATGKNDGKEVVAYLNYTGNRKGEPWCASFVSWVFGQAGFGSPRTAWSPDLFPKANRVPAPAPAMVFGIYFTHLKRIAHCGIVEKEHHNWLTTIEGNTDITGSREGDGVYRKLRHVKTVKFYADWIARPKKGEAP